MRCKALISKMLHTVNPMQRMGEVVETSQPPKGGLKKEKASSGGVIQPS